MILDKEMLNLLKILLTKSQVFIISHVIDKDFIGRNSELKLTKLTFAYIFSKIAELKRKEKERELIQ
jgi:hypothetical protein